MQVGDKVLSRKTQPVSVDGGKGTGTKKVVGGRGDWRCSRRRCGREVMTMKALRILRIAILGGAVGLATTVGAQQPAAGGAPPDPAAALGQPIGEGAKKPAAALHEPGAGTHHRAR